MKHPTKSHAPEEDSRSPEDVASISFPRLVSEMKAHTLDQISKYVGERGQRERQVFDLAQSNHKILKSAFLREYERIQNEDVGHEFELLYELATDGIIRNRTGAFDQNYEAGVFIGSPQHLTTELRHRVITAKNLIARFGLAWRSRFQNTYVTMPENVMVIFWPEVSWCENAGKELHIPDEEYFWISDTEHNPDRDTAWSGLFFDHVAGVWMVSCETPIDFGGRHIATIGHDIMLDEFLERTVHDSLAGSYNLIFRDDGRLIAHPELMDEIKHHDGQFDISQSGNEHLNRVYDCVIGGAQGDVVIENETDDEYLAVTVITGPDWHFVTVFPSSSVTARQFAEREQQIAAFNAERARELKRVNEELEVRVLRRTQELAEKETHLRLAMDSMPGGMLMIDKDLNLVISNDQYSELFSFPEGLLAPGKSIVDMYRYQARRGDYGDGDPESLVEGMVNWVRSQESGRYERHILSGRTMEILMSSTPDGGTVAVARDISLQKQAEDELINARETAESANIAKSSFLATMSHEIRTPLNGVLGLAQLLKYTTLDEDQTSKVNTILSSGHILLSIINDVLDMSKIEAGGLEFEERAFSLSELVSTITTPFQSLADDKGLKLGVTSNISSGLVIKGDPVRLRQILWNLLSNAIKFTDKGNISLTIDVVGDAGDIEAFGLDAKDHLLFMAVEDTGAGIAPDRVDSIFDAFTQEDSSITRKHGGTGLGLSIVKQLTELLGGTIEADSELGKGTKFVVYIPFDAATEEEVEAVTLRSTSSSVEKMKPLKILIAEDNEVNAVIAKAFLEKFGHSVKHVENGLLAVEAAEEDWADLILMDIHMPEMNGIDATRAIRATEIGRNIPIVGLTAEAFAERHAEFKEAGMMDVLTKPFTEQQLADTLATNRLIDRRKSNRNEKVRPTPDGNFDGIEDDSVDPVETPNSEAAAIQVGDEEKLNAFRQQIDSKTISALLEKAQESLLTRMEDLREGIDASDPDQIRQVAHSIRGASGSMFATRMSSLAAVVETQYSDIDAVRQLMPEFEEVAKETIGWWRSKST